MHTYILTDHSLTVLIGTKPYTIPSSHPNFEEIKSLLPTDTPIEHLIDIPKSIEQFFDGRISISPQTNTLTFDDQPIDNTLTRKILEFIKSQSPNLAEPLVNFLVRSRQNPSYRTTNNLYEWVSKSGLPITPDGFILAWKAVNGDLYDYHAQKNQHLPGAIISQPRNECDEDPDQTCSAGLHFCSAEYLPQYLHRSDVRVVVVKIDPADVVAIPRDYGISKGRCCKYEVVAECPKEDVAGFFGTSLVADPTHPTLRASGWDVWEDEEGVLWEIVHYEGSDDTYKAETLSQATLSVRWFHPGGRPVDRFSGYSSLVRKVS